MTDEAEQNATAPPSPPHLASLIELIDEMVFVELDATSTDEAGVDLEYRARLQALVTASLRTGEPLDASALLISALDLWAEGP